jgi:hypothetical protein
LYEVFLGNQTEILLIKQKKKIRNRTCRAEFAHDAPVAAAIGACMLSSLVLPVTGKAPDSDGDSGFDLADTRFSVMGIISFIPYFNWLVKIFYFFFVSFTLIL